MGRKEHVQPIELPYSLVKKNPFGFPQWEDDEHKRRVFKMKQGFERGVQEIARRMLKYQFDPEFISWTTGLTDAELEEIDPYIDLSPKAIPKIAGYKVRKTKTDTVCEVMRECMYDTEDEEQ